MEVGEVEKHMKRAVLVCVVVAGLGWGQAVVAQEVKFGYVDAQQVLDRSKIGQVSKEQLEQYVKSRQQLIDADEAELRQMEEEIKKQASVLSPEAQREKQETMQRKLFTYQKRAGDLSKEVQEKKAEVLKEFNKQLSRAVQQVAERGGYTMVFDRENEGGAILYAKAKMDLTDPVVAELDKAAVKGDAPAKPMKSGDGDSSGKTP